MASHTAQRTTIADLRALVMAWASHGSTTDMREVATQTLAVGDTPTIELLVACVARGWPALASSTEKGWAVAFWNSYDGNQGLLIPPPAATTARQGTNLR